MDTALVFCQRMVLLLVLPLVASYRRQEQQGLPFASLPRSD